MKKIIIIVLFFILQCTVLKSQDDSIKNEIRDYPDSRLMLNLKARNLLYDKILENDTNKVLAIRNFLLNSDTYLNMISLSPIESYLILLWAKKYSELINIFDYNYFLIINDKKIVLCNFDSLNILLSIKIGIEKYQITYDINNSKFSSEDKDFLLLLNLWLPNISKFSYQFYDYQNYCASKQAKIFLNTYPNSKYKKFVESDIDYNQKLSDWSYSIAFLNKYYIATKNLSTYFPNSFQIGNGFGLNYKDLYSYFHYSIGNFSRTKKDIEFSDGVWKSNSKYGLLSFEFELGYFIYQRNYLKIIPFLGYSCLRYNSEDNNYKNAKLPFISNYQLGTSISYNLCKLDNIENLNIIFKYSYNFPQYSTPFNGNIHCITLGIEVFERDYIKPDIIIIKR